MLLSDNHCESNSNEHNSDNRYHYVPVYLLHWDKILEEELNCTLMSHILSQTALIFVQYVKGDQVKHK